MNRKYERKCVIFRQLNKSYSKGNHECICNLEIKQPNSKFMLFGKEFAKGDKLILEIYFIAGSDGNTGYLIKTTDVDTSGQFVAKIIADSDNINDFGFPVEDIKAVVIKTQLGENLMAGLLDETYDLGKLNNVHYISSYLNEEKTAPEYKAENEECFDSSETEPPLGLADSGERIIEEHEETISDAADIPTRIDEESVNSQKYYKLPVDSLNDNEAAMPEAREADIENQNQEFSEKIDDFNEKFNILLSEDNHFKKSVPHSLDDLSNDSIELIYSNNPKLNPFSNIKHIEWVRICENEIALLPIEISTLVNNTFLGACYGKHNHFMLGKTVGDRSEKKLYLAIPDIYSEENKLIASTLGFNRFKFEEDKSPDKESYGYWIMEF